MKKIIVVLSVLAVAIMSGGSLLMAQQVSVINDGYDYISGQLPAFNTPDHGQIQMRKKALAKIYAKDEDISSFKIPVSTTNGDITFLSTIKSSNSSGNWQNAKSLNQIYQYNVKTGAIKLIYNEKASRLLRTVGMEGNKLILLYDGIDNSPGPCYSYWQDNDFASFGYLDITKPKSKLQPYTVPQYKKDAEQATVDKCFKENFGE